MSYDEHLADRVRAIAVELSSSIDERAMFGGLCFTLGGKMFAGIVGDELMVRVGPSAYESALGEPHVREMDFTGKPMRGYVYVGTAALRRDRDLSDWIERGLAGARSAASRPTTRQPRKRVPRRR